MPPVPVNPNRSNLSAEQIFQRAFDESTDKLRTDASVNAEITGDVYIEVDAADGDNVAIGDGTKTASITTVGSKNGLDVNVINDLNFEMAGMSNGIYAWRQTVTDSSSPIEIPASFTTKSITIRVLGTSVVYFGGVSVTDLTGYPKFQYEELIADIDTESDAQIYVVCAAGQTSELAIMGVG